MSCFLLAIIPSTLLLNLTFFFKEKFSVIQRSFTSSMQSRKKSPPAVKKRGYFPHQNEKIFIFHFK